MDQNEKQKLKTVEKLDKNCYFLRRTLQLVVSVALFSVILCYSSGFSFFPHSFNVYFSTFLFSFFTHTLERKYMFLICNGILAFLAKTSVSNSTTSSLSAASDLGDELSAFKASVVDDEIHAKSSHEEEQVVQVKEGEAMEEAQEEEENESLYREKEGRESEALIAEDEERETNDELSNSNTDELNKRIEEFIKKMKEEIRIEAQIQLIAV